MKKIKLFAPAFSLAAIASAPAAMVSCSKSTPAVVVVNVFCNDGGALAGQTVLSIEKGTKWGDVANKPQPQPKEGYTFAGWYRSNTKIEDSTVIDSVMDIYAWFEATSPTQCYVTVIAAPGGQLGTQGTALTSSTIIATSAGTRWGNIKPDYTPDANYKFTGWFMNDKEINDDTIISGNSFIFAWFDAVAEDKCLVRFEALTGGTFQNITGVKDIVVDKGATWATIKSQAPTPVALQGYKFNEGEWYLNKESTPITDETQITDTCYIFAYFEKTNCKITIESVEHATVPSDPIEVSVGSFNSVRAELEAQVVPEQWYEISGWVDEKGDRIYDDYRCEVDKKVKPIISPAFNRYEFNETTKEATVYGRINDQVDLMVPTYAWQNGEKYKVTGTKYQDGTGYYDGNSTIKTLCLPYYFTNIRDRAFRSTSLTAVYLPASTAYFGYHSFYKTSSLKKFVYLGKMEEFVTIRNGGWWCNGMGTSVAICVDGVISFS